MFCFGIASTDDPLLIDDLWVPKQKVGPASAELDEDDMALRISEMAQSSPMSRFMRVWLHTHPGSSAAPSGTDRESQHKIFGQCEWSVMGILAKEGAFHCELSWWGPDHRTPMRVQIPHQVDWSARFDGADPDQWSAEYVENVTTTPTMTQCQKDWYGSSALWTPNEPMGGALTAEEEERFRELARKCECPLTDVTDEDYEELLELEERFNARQGDANVVDSGGEDHHFHGGPGPQVGWGP